MANNRELGLGDLGGIMPPVKPNRKKGVTIDLEHEPVPSPKSNLDEVNEELKNRFGDLADPPETLYIKDTPEEIEARRSQKEMELTKAMENEAALRMQQQEEEARAMASVSDIIPKDMEVVSSTKVEEATPKTQKVNVLGSDALHNLNLDSGSLKKVDPFAVAPRVERESDKDPVANEIYEKLDEAVERTKKQISADQEALFEKMHEEFVAQKEAEIEKEMEESPVSKDFDLNSTEDEDDGLDSAEDIKPEKKSNSKVVKMPSASTDDEDDLSDLGFDEDDMTDDLDTVIGEEEETPEEREAKLAEVRKEITKEIHEKITPIRNRIDFTKFTVSRTPISSMKVMKAVAEAPVNTADWVFPMANRRFTMSALTGAEIINLNPRNSSQNQFNTLKNIHRILYNHIVDANKPDFETWLKELYLADVPHLYIGAYRATFGQSNFMPASCSDPDCARPFLNDVNFDDIVVYANDEVKEKVRALLEGDTTSGPHEIKSELYQISDNYVVSLHAPSVYSTIMETASLPPKFTQKYSDMLDVISYIDQMFVIDEKSSSLLPIEVKKDPNSVTKTAAYKIRTFHNILKTVSSDIYSNLYGYILKEYEDKNEIHFQLPACTCPKCGKEVPAEEIEAQQLLFTRHQLAAYGNM